MGRGMGWKPLKNMNLSRDVDKRGGGACCPMWIIFFYNVIINVKMWIRRRGVGLAMWIQDFLFSF